MINYFSSNFYHGITVDGQNLEVSVQAIPEANTPDVVHEMDKLVCFKDTLSTVIDRELLHVL